MAEQAKGVLLEVRVADAVFSVLLLFRRPFVGFFVLAFLANLAILRRFTGKRVRIPWDRGLLAG
jgi:hypothetical protein